MSTITGKFRAAVIHPGHAHRDEILSLGLALMTGLIDGDTPVLRTDPSPGMLNDPGILVLDIGGKYEPEKGNFDHHQLPRGTQECTLSLLAKHIRCGAQSVHDVFMSQSWYNFTIDIDALGPTKAVESLQMSKLPAALNSPFEASLLRSIRDEEFVPRWVLGLAHKTMTCMYTQAVEYNRQVRMFDAFLVHVSVMGIPGVFANFKDIDGLSTYLESRGIKAGFSISLDDRGNGYTLYRFNDDTRLDFSLLEDHPDILFAHKGGFIAKTNEPLRFNDLLGLVGISYVGGAQ